MAKKNSGAEETVEMAIYGFGSMFRQPWKFLIFAIAVLGCAYVFTNYEIIAEQMNLEGTYKLLLFTVIFIPIILLVFWGRGGSQLGTSVTDWEKIGFKNRVGEVPKQVAKYRAPNDKRIIIYEFKSAGIPLQTWMERQRDIENVLNLTIRNIRESQEDKQIIVLDTVSAKHKLPISTREKPFMWQEKFLLKDEAKVVVGMGELDPLTVDLNKFPHMLMAGTTGSGKSVIVQCMLWQLVKKGAIPIIIDFKGGIEFGGEWENYGTVVTELDDALDIVQRLYLEQEARFRFLRDDGIKYGYDCKNIAAYNKKHPDNPMSRIVFVVDEAGDLLSSEGADKDTKAKIQQLSGNIASLAMKSRAVGINMIFGIQRPDAKVLTGQIRNNIPIKVCGRAMGGDGRYLSEMVLGDAIATTLDSTIEGRFYGNFGMGVVQFQSYYFEPHQFLTPGDWRKGFTLVLDNPPEKELKDDSKYYEKIDEVETEKLDWSNFGKGAK